MDVYKLIGLGIVGTLIVLIVKGSKSEMGFFVGVCAGIIMLVYILSSLNGVVKVFSDIVNKTGIDGGLFSGVLKVIGLGYVTEYSAGLCSDAGCSGIGSKILLGGKIAIFMVSLPVLEKLVDLVIKLIP